MTPNPKTKKPPNTPAIGNVSPVFGNIRLTTGVEELIDKANLP